MFSPESEDSSTEQQPWQIVKWDQKLPCEKQGTRASRKLPSDANFDFTWHDCLAALLSIRLSGWPRLCAVLAKLSVLLTPADPAALRGKKQWRSSPCIVQSR